MKFQKFDCHQILKNCIAYYWTLSSTEEEWAKTYRFIPDTYVEWIFHLKNPWEYSFANNPEFKTHSSHLLGHFKKHMNLKLPNGPFLMFGIKFYPTTANPFWKIDMNEATGKHISLAELNDHDLLRLEEQFRNQKTLQEVVQLADQFLVSRIEDLPKNDLSILTNRLNKGDQPFSLDDFAVSPRRIEQRFKQEIGISPKLFQRTLRINKIIDKMLYEPYSNLTELAYQFNFTDQSHFIRDFKLFTGITPYKFLKRTQPQGDIFNLALD